MACNTSTEKDDEKDTASATNRPVEIQGHRGCRGLMPENTIAAMIRALELGVQTLEMDVVITADSVCLLSHEPFFSHEITTLPNGELLTEENERNYNIYKMTVAETQQYDVGKKPHPRFAEQQKMAAFKPTLNDVIDAVKAWCSQNNKPLPYFNIETKTSPSGDNEFHPEPARFVELLMQVISQQALDEKVIVQSFDFRTLQYLHQYYPGIATAALIEDFDLLPAKNQLEKLGFTPTIYSPAWQLVTDSLVSQMHALQVKVIPWTINDSASAARLKNMGVDGLITDYPDRVK